MQQTSTIADAQRAAAQAPVNVLIVDDRPANLLALEAILEPLGENLIRANSGEEALTHLLSTDFAVILLDVAMPTMDGFETARQIKQRPASAATPIMFLTANSSDPRLMLQGYQLGAADYLLKPLTPEVVQSKVAVFCALYRSREQTRLAAAEVARAQIAETQAKENERQLTDVLERISDAFFALDNEWRFTYVNEKAALLLHRQRKDLAGKVIWEEFPDESNGVFYDHYRRAVETQSSVAFTDYYPPLDSWFEVHAYPSREGLSVYFEDISDKQRAQRLLQSSERRYRSLVEAAAAAVWKTDRHGLIVAEEDDWRLLTGQSFDQMKGSGWLDAIHPADRARTVDSWRRALASGATFEMEHRVRTHSGEYRDMIARAVPVFDATGQIEEWVGTHTDITARKYAEEQRDSALDEAVTAREAAERAREEAEVANRGKSEFLATMSHEFRTPLNAILGYTQIIDMGVLGAISSQQHDHLQRLRASAVHLLGLVNDVLDLSKIEAGRVNVSRETGLISDVVRASMALVGPQAIARGIDFPDECEGEAGTSYVGDPDRVRQILVNLLSNAVKFTNPGGAVRLICGSAGHPDPGARLAPEGPWSFIRVSDTGIGVPREQLTRIFEPFVQATTGYTRTEGGTGLGLAISRRLARLMGGDITVQSEVGRGSTFTLWLKPGVTDSTRTPTAEYPAFHDPVPEVDSDAVRDIAARLVSRLEHICERYVDRLRAEAEVPDLTGIAEPYIRDHANTVITEITVAASQLAETKGRASDLLRDGAEIQRLLAELHGAQRYRLGWTEAQIQKDVDSLSAEIVAATIELNVDPAATAFMVDVVRKILDQWKQTSIRGHRFARAAGKH